MYDKQKHFYIERLKELQSILGLTNTEMAELLYIPKTTYTNLIYHKGGQITFEIIMRVYELNGGMMYLMTGAARPKELEMSEKFNKLNDAGKRILEATMNTLIAEPSLRK